MLKDGSTSNHAIKYDANTARQLVGRLIGMLEED